MSSSQHLEMESPVLFVQEVTCLFTECAWELQHENCRSLLLSIRNPKSTHNGEVTSVCRSASQWFRERV